ncbi:MAG: 6-bladed beta-propeller, partial [Bacteroidales bacterium]|nr:6-bladed beta-propeller [Bacteroidales bacterium]
KKGRGPGEYSRLVNFFVNPENGCLYITTSQALLCYDNDFNFVKEIEKPEKDLFLISAKPVSKDIYAMVSNGKRHSIMIVGEDTTDVYFKKSTEREFLGNDYMHKITLFPIFQAVSQIRYLSVLNDTIYTFTDDFKEEAVYYLNYGKYKEPEQVTVEDFGSMDMNFISFFTISESNDLIFMYFLLRGLCKEPIVDTLTNHDGIQKVIKSNIGYAVYDKKMNEVKFLLQPIKGLMGFADDLTDGVPFWPRYVNSNNKLISYLTPQKIKNFAESNDTAGESIKNLASKLTENDNPVIIIVTPK